MTRIAADPKSLKLTAKALLDARGDFDIIRSAVEAETATLAAAPGTAAARAAGGVAALHVQIEQTKFHLWQHSQHFAIAAVRFEQADNPGKALGYADFLLRYYGKGIKKFTGKTGKLLTKLVKLRVKYIAYHPSSVPDIQRLAKLKGINKAANRFGAFAGLLGKVLTARELAEKFNEGADAQFKADARRGDLSDFQLQARAAISGLANIADDLGEIVGSMGATALAAFLGVTGAICGLIGTPVGSIVGGIVGAGVGFAAGWFGSSIGKRVGHMAAPQLRKLINTPLLNVGHQGGAALAGGGGGGGSW